MSTQKLLKSPGSLLKLVAGGQLVSDSIGLSRAPGIYISNKYSGYGDIVVPGTTTENDYSTLRNNYLFHHEPQ